VVTYQQEILCDQALASENGKTASVIRGYRLLRSTTSATVGNGSSGRPTRIASYVGSMEQTHLAASYG
jgi:hypothetical protein